MKNAPLPKSSPAPRDEAAAAQRKASRPQDNIWVGASAGSGKTKVLTDRVLRLLLPRKDAGHDSATHPDKILSITYTRTAAAEMEERIASVLSRWAVMDDAGLRHEIADLAGYAPSPEMIADARRLFARVVDTPGGMKIMTIHSFCQSVLKRFPLEAGLSPHFEVIDDRTAIEYLLKAQHDILLSAEGEMADHARAVTASFNETDLADFIKSLSRRRDAIFSLLSKTRDLRRDILEKLGLPRDASVAQLTSEAIGGVDRPALVKAADAMQNSSSARDNERGATIAAWLEGGIPLAEYARAYIGKSTGEIFDPLAYGPAVKKFPDILGVLQKESERILSLLHKIQLVEAAGMTQAALQVAGAILRRYEACKSVRGQLDYDDLILKTAELLGRKDHADWVLFKLDGGIDHVLVDEAQDTSPEQWQVIDALTAEFFSGLGARGEKQRTLFIVGDEKQSIFSFQGADPSEFKRRFVHFSNWLSSVDLKISFRSTSAVLEVVDAVFAEPLAKQGVVFDISKKVEHFAARQGQAGLIEIWPVIYPDKKAETEAWDHSDEHPGEMRDSKERLAAVIAETISAWIEKKEHLTARGRPIRPGDVLVLVQRRNSFVDMLVRALKSRAIPVAGVDRMVLTEQIAIMDLMATAGFCLLPEDNLTLAALLKTPLIGMTEERLFDLCHGRKGTLWENVQKLEPAIAAWLESLRQTAGKVTPYVFFSWLLSGPCPADAISGWRAFFGRLGPDVREAIEEFLNIALDFERLHPPSLQLFLNWFEKGQSEIKRDHEQSSENKVRIMTVHASKGLQAPIVFLPDTVFTPKGNSRKREKIFWPEEGSADPVLWLPPKSDGSAGPIRDIVAKIDKMKDEEYRRLLYVALTRAADRLYVCGYGARNKAPENCWHSLVARAFRPLSQEIPFMASGRPVTDRDDENLPLPALRYVSAQEKTPEDERKKESESPRLPLDPLPDWARQKPSAEKTPPRPLKPSAALDDETPVRSPLGEDDGWRFRRGLLVHRLLEILPGLGEEKRKPAAQAFLTLPAHDLAPKQQAELCDEVMGILSHPDFAPIFGPGSMAEVPVVSLLGKDDVLSGQIDRICVTGKTVLIVDYKTNRPPPFHEKDVAPVYLRQMALYRAAARKIWPDKEIRCALLWTDMPRLMPLSGERLDPYNPVS